MANRTLYPSQSYGSGRVYLEFQFQANGASQPALSAVDGSDAVASLNRTGVGVIVVTLKDSFNKVIYAGADIDDTLNDGAYATVSNVTNEGTSSALTFTVRTRNAAGTAADMAAARKIGVVLILRNGNWGTK